MFKSVLMELNVKYKSFVQGLFSSILKNLPV